MKLLSGVQTRKCTAQSGETSPAECVPRDRGFIGFPQDWFQQCNELLSSRVSIHVPTGIAAFPQEIVHVPRVWTKNVYKNIVTYTYMPRGGHFAAFEEPKLLAQDIMQFVRKVEQL